MKITVLSGGVGGARFLRGLRAHVTDHLPGTTITAVVNTGDDMWLTGLRIAPDLDSIMYTLAGQNDEERGWGRIGETERVSGELRAYGVGWPWFTLGDLDLGTHITRSHLLREGLTLAEATDRITSRWDLGVRLIPATNDEVETHVVVDDPDADAPGADAPDGAPASNKTKEMHFQEWWTRHRATLPAKKFLQIGVEGSTAAPGVVDAILGADVVLFAPSNPVVSIGTILGIPGIREAVASTDAPVVGVSPIIGGAVVRGMADACLTAIGVETSASAVAAHYGSRASGGVLDAWLVADEDAAVVHGIEAAGIRSSSAPLWMRDVPASAAIAAAALELGQR